MLVVLVLLLSLDLLLLLLLLVEISEFVATLIGQVAQEAVGAAVKVDGAALHFGEDAVGLGEGGVDGPAQEEVRVIQRGGGAEDVAGGPQGAEMREQAVGLQGDGVLFGEEAEGEEERGRVVAA